MIEDKTRWTSEQFNGRLGNYLSLPKVLCQADLEKVARALLPEGDATSIEILVRYAQASSKYLAGIEFLVKRARYLAGKESRSKVNRADIKRALKEGVLLADSALAKAMQPPLKASGRRSVNLPLADDLQPVNNRSTERAESNLLDEQSSEGTGRNRLELHREGGALVP